MSIKTFRAIITAFFLCVFVVFSVYRIRMLLVADATAPVITAPSDTIEASVTVTDEQLMADMRAEDNIDGDVTDTLVVASKSKFIKKGVLRVNYAAFDKSNNVGVYTRELSYTDYVSPRFSISQPLHFLSGESGQNIMDYITARDCISGNITSQIMYTLGETRMLSDKVSVRTANIQVTNAAGDTSVLEVELYYDDYASYHTQAPHLSDYVMYVKVGDTPDYKSRIDGIWVGGVSYPFSETEFSRSSVVIDSKQVDTDKAGVYPVYYWLKGADGKKLGTAKLLVVVEE